MDNLVQALADLQIGVRLVRNLVQSGGQSGPSFGRFVVNCDISTLVHSFLCTSDLVKNLG